MTLAPLRAAGPRRGTGRTHRPSGAPRWRCAGGRGRRCSLAGCASHNGADLARQACRHVERSLALYQASLHATDAARCRAQQAQAVAELRDALPIAATAAGEAGQYQALMATLAESDHLPESLLVHALGRAVRGGQRQRRASSPRLRPRPGHRPPAPPHGLEVTGSRGSRRVVGPTSRRGDRQQFERDTGARRPRIAHNDGSAGARRSPDQTEGLKPAGRLMDFFSRNSSRPSGPNSRPMPDSL